MTHWLTLELPASDLFLGLLGACVLEAVALFPSATAEDANRVQLAVHEVAANIIQHAYAERPDGRIHVEMRVDVPDERFSVELVDTGVSFDPGTVLPPNPDALQERGYGLWIARQVMDAVDYQPMYGGNRWRLLKQF